MSERKAMLILHGKQALNEEVRAAVERKREEGWELAVRLTWEAGDAQRLVDEALVAGYTRLIAGGGDGTLRDIAEAMAAQANDASLVLLPLGTANDFARAAGVSLLPHEALNLLDVPARAIDLGEVGGQVFLNMATGGFGSQVTANTSEDLKKILGARPICSLVCPVSTNCMRHTVSCRGRISIGAASCWPWGSATGARPVVVICCALRRWPMTGCWMSVSCRPPGAGGHLEGPAGRRLGNRQPVCAHAPALG